MTLTRSLSRQPAPLLIWHFARLEAGSAWRRLGQIVGIGRPCSLDFAEIAPPDSAPIAKAEALCRRVAPDFIVNHSIRAYCFAAAIAHHLGASFDREVVYAATLLHDLGLTEHGAGSGSFEVRGAKVAHDFLMDSGMAQDRADLAHEAIALHSAVGVADRREIEVRLTHFGTGLDVIGFRSEAVAAATRDDIVARYPRHGFKEQFIPLLEGEVADNPRCHIAGHMALGFPGKIRSAPFDG